MPSSINCSNDSRCKTLPSIQTIDVAARQSPLSKAQVQEVLAELHQIAPDIQFHCHFLKTSGDIDQITSLRTLDKTDFFTREIDRYLLEGHCRIAIHSAKDLPFPLPNGITVVAITRGLNPYDALVFREGENLKTLPAGSIIATSSERREEAVKQLRADFRFVDIRGTIEQRIAKLSTREVDGVVIAEAALMRLNLTHLNRILLPGKTAHLQGRLAVVAREGDLEMKSLFQSLDGNSC